MDKKKQNNDLSIMRGLKEETVKMLLKEGQIKKYKRCEIIFRARENVEYVFIQLSGKTITYNLTHSGKRKIIFILGRGALLNDKILSEGIISNYCEAIEACEILRIPILRFQEMMKQDYDLTKCVLAYQENKACRLSHQLKNTMGSIYMERKLSAKLWKLARDFGIEKEDGVEIDINMSITLLADFLGTPRETASRLCKTLTDYGLIRMDKKRVLIRDPNRLLHFYKTGELE